MSNKILAGIDEVGRGCLAGPVVSCVVIFKENIKKKLLKDSKMISFKNRLYIADHIKKNSWFSIGIATVSEIDKYNILNASMLSMERAVNKLKKKPDLYLIDGVHAPKKMKNFKTIIKGDQKIKCISAASIVAKVFRDKLMIQLSEKFSNYAWESNFGYGTKAHLAGLKKFGITSHHRKGFRPVHKILSS